MKTLICIVLLLGVFVTSSYSWRIKRDVYILQPFIDECQRDFNVTTEELHSDTPLPKDKKCFHLCVITKIGLMDIKGGIHFDEFKKRMSHQMTHEGLEIIEKCADVKKEEACLTAEAICRCFHGKKEPVK